MSDWIPSLNALRAFEAAARHGSYKKAADELSVTPAAVKQLVSKLEEAIGGELLTRKGRAIELTPLGETGSSDLTGAFEQISLAVRRMRTTQRTDRLVVSVDPSFASAWLVPRLEAFKKDNPDIEVLVSSSMEIVDLTNETADIGIRFGVEDHGELVAHRLFHEELRAFCSPQFAAGPPRISSLEDLEHTHLLRWDISDFAWAKTTRKWNLWSTWLGAIGASEIKPGTGAMFNDYNLAVQAAIAGQGLVLGSSPILRQLIDTEMLVDPFGVCALPGIGYDVVTTRESLARPNVARFLEWLQTATSET